MSTSPTLASYLRALDIEYALESHPHTQDSTHTAEQAHVPGQRLAKAVMLEDDDGYVMAVIPASRRLALGEVHRAIGRSLGLATEGELPGLFPDCETGAIPPVGRAYGIDTLVDLALLDEPEIWFEAGDHESVVHVDRNQFRALMADARPGRFAVPA